MTTSLNLEDDELLILQRPFLQIHLPSSHSGMFLAGIQKAMIAYLPLLLEKLRFDAVSMGWTGRVGSGVEMNPVLRDRRKKIVTPC